MSTSKRVSSRDSKSKRKDNLKKSKLREEEEEDDDEVDPNSGLAYGEDDEFYKKWAGPVLLGPFIPAILSLFIIVAGQLVLNNWTGTCGYDLECELSFFFNWHFHRNFLNGILFFQLILALK
jgi:hypothetical protein